LARLRGSTAWTLSGAVIRNLSLPGAESTRLYKTGVFQTPDLGADVRLGLLIRHQRRTSGAGAQVPGSWGARTGGA
jgi:hypothetical protein